MHSLLSLTDPRGFVPDLAETHLIREHAGLVDFGARAVEGNLTVTVASDGAIRVMENARRLVLAQMDDLECRPRDDLRDLRSSVLSVPEPLEDDPTTWRSGRSPR